MVKFLDKVFIKLNLNGRKSKNNYVTISKCIPNIDNTFLGIKIKFRKM